ncbi:MAG: response regulator [Gammaproteobacteria bacterium]
MIEAQVQRQTRELAEARDQALQASRVKSDFLASMSHEIRTPLNAIIGMADLLSETRLDFDQEKYVSVFRKAGEALLSLVNDILDLSKIEAGQLELESIAFDPRELIEAAVEIYAHRGAEKGVELICLVAPAVPAMLVGDPARLRQVVLNLIGNAIKFTERGEIVVRMAPADEPEVPGRVLISVTDTGIGIPQDKQDAIFSSFTQVDSSTTRKYGGTGLGLAISRRLVEMMHGRIWVESELGRGSCFNVVVQCGVGDVTRGAVAQDLRGLRILAVDDIDTNRMVLQQTLSSLGAEVVLAQDAAVALHAFAQARDAGRAFDLVLTDYRMPGMDGFEFAGALAAAGGDVKTVVMLTSANLAQDISRARDMGLGGYLVKPIKRMDLLRAIHAVLAVPAQDVGAVARAPVGQQAQARILLVEDNADNRLLINAYLKNEPYRIDTAEHGAQAVEMFIADPYSLVLMDVQMPVMDGHEATRAIRAWEREAGRAPVPIIALTAHATREEMEKSLAAGCSSHLTKPIKKSVLLESIRQGLS